MERRVKARKAWRPSGSAQTVSAAVAAAAGGGLEVGWRWEELALCEAPTASWSSRAGSRRGGATPAIRATAKGGSAEVRGWQWVRVAESCDCFQLQRPRSGPALCNKSNKMVKNSPASF